MSVLVGLVPSAVQRVREAAARVKCQNSVRQLALALHHYHDTHNSLPAGHRSFSLGQARPFSGWTLDILPYVEQPSLSANAAEAYRRSLLPFANPPHTGLSAVVNLYVCPVEDRAGEPQFAHRSKYLVALTCYLGVSGLDYSTRNGVLHQDSRVRLTDVRDGTSNTLMIGERPPSADFQYGWWYAGAGQRGTGSGDMILGVREQNLLPVMSGSCPPGSYPFGPGRQENQCSMFHFWSLHAGGANFAFADGSVRFLSYSADAILPALATRAGREAVSVPN